MTITGNEYQSDNGDDLTKHKTTVGFALLGTGLAILVIGAIVLCCLREKEEKNLIDRKRLKTKGSYIGAINSFASLNKSILIQSVLNSSSKYNCTSNQS